MIDIFSEPQAAIAPVNDEICEHALASQIDHDVVAGQDRAPATIIPFPAPVPADPAETYQSAPSGSLLGGEGGEAPSLPSTLPSIALDDSVPAEAIVADDVYRPAPETNPVVAALTRKGLYGRWVGGNEHRITCPFAGEHAPGEAQEARYYAPSDEVPMGAFHCPCRHAEKRRIGALLDHLDVERRDAFCLPIVRIKSGHLHRSVIGAEKILAARGGFYRFNGMIVTLKTDPATGDFRTEPVTEQALGMALSAAAYFEKFDGRSEDWRRCDVPTNIVVALLKSEGCGALPVLKRLARQPYLNDAGELVTTPGYDAASGTFAAFDANAFDIPALTRDNALSAMGRMQTLLTEFVFENPADRTTAVSAMLTATIRDYLDLAPGFNITASSPGSGKSYLASVIAPFAGPGEPRAMSYPMTNEEATKVVLAIAIEQPAVVCFDDMPTDWLPHGALNRMLTNGWISERRLGTNSTITARANSFVMGTGNNIRPLRDMARRVASMYILPADREFTGDPAGEVRRHRESYVSDALTIIGAWKAAGSPKADVPSVPGFGQWSDLCRHSLIWLGLPDPAKSLIEQIAHDPDAETLGNLLSAWKETFGQRATMVRKILRHIDEQKQGDLCDAVMELPFVERGHVSQSKFGRYLARNKNRIVRGLQLVEADCTERRAWSVIPVALRFDKPSSIEPEQPEAPIERVWLDGMLAEGKTPPALIPAI
ncbi:hypothetical protein [Sphingomonas sp.]|uniref:hypothetical protein n=1 Tax=Sphingomonas sp. TaxID=28214 RepID=UPI000DB1CBC6|nr:hypothetical protein [Sphingomonas sp.]PZU09581.1 MAG: hypothetical protein DI605_07850 [Sphingomonas sp.]